MDKDQANTSSEALMSPARAEQLRKAERLRPKRPSPMWRLLGFGVMGNGIGIAIGSGDGNGLLFGAIGLAIGLGLGAIAVRRQA